MKLNFTVDTDDMYGGEDGMDFESLVKDSLQREVISNCKVGLASDKFKEFAQLASDTIISGIKLKMENFLSEEIVLTEGWGKPTFVGSIEDLIKKRFDEILLRPVDSSGKTLQGCTTSSTTKTWIEWMLTNRVNENSQSIVESAADSIGRRVKDSVTKEIIEIKDNAIKQQVGAVFASFVKSK